MPRKRGRKTAKGTSTAAVARPGEGTGLSAYFTQQTSLKATRETYISERQQMKAWDRMQSKVPYLAKLTLRSHLQYAPRSSDSVSGSNTENTFETQGKEIWDVILWACDCLVQALEEMEDDGQQAQHTSIMSPDFQVHICSAAFVLPVMHDDFRHAYQNIVKDFLVAAVLPAIEAATPGACVSLSTI